MTSRSTRIAPFILCVALAALGIWWLAEGDYVSSAFQFAFSASWLLIALRDRRSASDPSLSAEAPDQPPR